MVTVPPDTPPTTPAGLTVAMVLLLLVQVPPATESVSVVLKPAQMVVAPIMVPAVAVPLTVMFMVATALPQLLVTV